MDSKPLPDNNILRLRYSRVEPAVWLAHLDLMRTFERSIRRAGLPVAYSQGYNPRPHLAFALPIGVGLATLDDYVDVYLTEPVEPADLIERLNRSLPAGLSILAAVPVSGIGPSLMSRICAAEYILDGIGLTEAAEKISALPEDQPWLVEKNSKGKMVTVNIRPLLLEMLPEGPDRLRIRVCAGSKENMRPDLYLDALVSLGGLDAIAAGDTAVTRARLITLDDER